MKSLLIGICEESTTDIELMIQYLKIAEACLSINCEIHTYSSGTDLLNSFRPVFDIIFINLPMPDIDSKTLLKQLRQFDAHLNIVLTSETSELFPIGYEYSAKNYYVKPLWYSMVLNELIKNLANESILFKPHLWISNQQGNYKLYLHKLQYIETSNRKLVFHYENKQIYHNGRLSDFQQQLPADFFRCNNSYIVNIKYIEQIKRDINRYNIYLITGECIPLSRNKKKELNKILNIS